MLHCPHCGAHASAHTRHGGGVLSFAAGSGADAPDALRELTQQAKSAPPELARIIRIIRDRLRVQDSAATTIERGLARTFRAVIDALREVLAARPGETVAARAARMRMDARFLRDLLMGAGLGDLIGEVTDAQAELAELAAAGQDAGGVQTPALRIGGAVVPQASATAITAATTDFVERFWERKIIVPTTDRLLEGLQSSLSGESLEAAVERLRGSLDASIPTAITEARTRIAEFDRAVVAQSAAEAGAELYLYLGPVDRITRGFCAQLADLVLTRPQIGRLDNAQTAASPLFTGGGYNCRHQFSPVTPALVKGLGLTMATDDDIDRANERARAAR